MAVLAAMRRCKACRIGEAVRRAVDHLGHLRQRPDRSRADTGDEQQLGEIGGATIGCSGEAAVEAGADFVKTSTGFNGGGATAEDVALMRKAVGPDLGVKASGGVRSLADAQAMIAAGATRIGASSGIAIVKGEQGSSDY